MRSRRTNALETVIWFIICHMNHPCQGVVVRGGGELDPYVTVPANSFPSGWESYQIDVSQGYVGGQPIVSGNPAGCLDTQMHNFSRTQGGGGAAGPVVTDPRPFSRTSSLGRKTCSAIDQSCPLWRFCFTLCRRSKT